MLLTKQNKKYSILYVDDEENNLLIFKDTFRRSYNVFTAKSAIEGRAILKNNKIDIILSDQRMPNETGVEFFKNTLKDYQNINRILITGYTDFSAIKTAINDAKIYQYVQKPWREDDLKNTIKEALKIYELERENENLLNSLKETNSKLEIEKARAEESDRLKSVFLSNLSHEIRTPMNGIIGFSNLLRDNSISENKKNKFIDIIIRSSNQLLKIIDDIVEISRFQTNQITVKKNAFDINQFFEDITAICRTQLGDKNITIGLNSNIGNDNCKIISDEIKLNKITSNIIENAIRYTNEGFININYEIAENKLIVKISDSGIGISPEMHNEIFERFRQEDKITSDAFGGLGLGLAIVKENIEILNGKIKVESEKDKGSTFTFEIPIEIA